MKTRQQAALSPPSHPRWKRLYVLCLLSLSGSVSSAKKAPTLSTDTPTSPYAQDLNDWVRARCNGDTALWVYQGVLVDPLEGRKIANVQGLELVKCIANVGVDHTHPIDCKRQYRHDLEVSALIQHPNATLDHAATLLSRKLFCYQPPDEPTQLLRQIKLRPNAPLRKIPIPQSIAVYDTATTFIARGPELICHTEWPDRQSIWARATRNHNPRNSPSSPDAEDKDTTTTASTKSFEFTIFARQKSAKKKPQDLFDLTTPPPTTHYNTTKDAVASPRRAKLIEFGTSSSRSKDKFGARETYSYTNIPVGGGASTAPPRRWFGLGGRRQPTATATPPAPPQVRYSRYGEGPPFVGPGRTCTLELQGTRVDSLDDIPPLLSSIIAERLSPRFLTNHTSLATTANKEDQQEAIPPWFRNAGPLLQALPQDEADGPGVFLGSLPDYAWDRGQKAWERVRRRVARVFGQQDK